MASLTQIVVGDHVRIDLPLEIIQLFQESMGGWSPEREKYLGQVGRVVNIRDGIALVEYGDRVQWQWNPAILVETSDPVMVTRVTNVGDVVRISRSEDEVKRLQENHGGWFDGMESILGRLGYVKVIYCTEDLRVKVGGKGFTLASDVCTKLSPTQIDQLKLETSRQSDAKNLANGDIVQLISDKTRLMGLQANHGNWSDEMNTCLGAIGYVKTVHPNGDLRIWLRNGLWTFNPAGLMKIADIGLNKETGGGAQEAVYAVTRRMPDSQTLYLGDKVRVINDVEILREFQTAQGEEFSEAMKWTAGEVGVVVSRSDSGVKVRVGEREWLYNPSVLSKLTDQEYQKAGELQVFDKVRVLNDRDLVESNQGANWSSSMQESLGKVGVVTRIDTGSIVVEVMGNTFTFNRACVERVPAATPISESETLSESDLAKLAGKVPDLQTLFSLLGLAGGQDNWRGALRAIAAASPDSGDTSNVTRLINAAIAGRVDVVKRCLDSDGMEVDTPCRGITPLMFACHEGQLQVVQLLLDRGADIHFRSPDSGSQPIHSAVTNNQVATIRLLLERGADIDSTDNILATPLHRAVGKGHTATVEELVKQKAKLTELDAHGETPVHIAVLTGQCSSMVPILRGGDDLTVNNEKGLTPFHLAAAIGNTEAIRVMITEGIRGRRIVQEARSGGEDMLQLATVNGHVETVRMLLDDAGANISRQADNGDTLLHLAVLYGRPIVANVLVEHGIDVNAVNHQGNTPLHVACMVGSVGGLEGLAQILSRLNFRQSVSPSLAGDIALYLIQKGADATRRNNDGKTAVELCLNAGMMDRMTRQLSGGGTSPDVQLVDPAPNDQESEPAEENHQYESISSSSLAALLSRPRAQQVQTASPDLSNEVHRARLALEEKIKQTMCPICKTNKKEVVFNCGHQACLSCANKTSQCPECDAAVIHRIRTYD